MQSKPELPDPASSRQTSSRAKVAKSWSQTPAAVSNDKYPSTEDRAAMFSQQNTRQLSASPPMFSYSSYPYTNSYGQTLYTSPSQYPSISSQYGEMLGHSPYLESLPASMSLVNPGKQASAYADEDILNPFSMSYASMAGIDISASTSQSDSHLQVRTALHPCRPGSRSHFPFRYAGPCG